MSGRLENKVAIITGAGSGIGRAAALLFASEGAKLVLGDKSAAVHDTARSVVEAGGEVTALQIDAGLESDVALLVATAKSAYGQLDVAFANAGISGGRDGIFDLTPEMLVEVDAARMALFEAKFLRLTHDVKSATDLAALFYLAVTGGFQALARPNSSARMADYIRSVSSKRRFFKSAPPRASARSSSRSRSACGSSLDSA